MRSFLATFLSLSLGTLTATTALAKPSTYVCKLDAVIASSAPKAAQLAPRSLELKYSIDEKENKAFLVSKDNQKSVSMVKTKDSLTFTDITRDGTVTTTQIQKNGDAIYGPLNLNLSKKPDLHYKGQCKKS
jgi:hypothetical protein